VADRIWIFLVFAVGYVILVEVISGLSLLLERRWRVMAR
jgi:glutamate transport system permease protein